MSSDRNAGSSTKVRKRQPGSNGGALNGRRLKLGKSLFSAKEWAEIGLQLELTSRESDIARLIFEEQTRKNIARRLHRSHNTIHTITSGLYVKLGVHNHVGLVLEIVRVGLSLRAKEQNHPNG